MKTLINRKEKYSVMSKLDEILCRFFNFFLTALIKIENLST